MKKKLTLKLRHKIPLTIVFVSTLVELIYAVLRVVLTEDTVDSFDILCIASCTGMLLLMWIPLFTDRMFNRVIPPTMYTSFVVFCFCGLILIPALLLSFRVFTSTNPRTASSIPEMKCSIESQCVKCA